MKEMVYWRLMGSMKLKAMYIHSNIPSFKHHFEVFYVYLGTTSKEQALFEDIQWENSIWGINSNTYLLIIKSDDL